MKTNDLEKENVTNLVTNSHVENFDMEKKFFAEKVRIFDAGGDVSKTWFVEYYKNDKRIQYKGGINRKKNASERYEVAKKIISELTEKDDTNIKTFLSEQLEKKELRKKSKLTYSSKINVFCEYCDKHNIFTIDQITEEFAKNFLTYLLKIKKSKSTYNSYKGILQSLLSGVNDAFLSPKSFAKKCGTPALYFQTFQIEILKKEFLKNSPNLWFFCQCIYYTLIRPNELRQIKISDIDLENKKIFVRGEVAKNKKSMWVAMPNALYDILIEKKIYTYPTNFYLFGCDGLPSEKITPPDHFAKKHQRILKTIHFDTTRHKLYSWKHTGAIALIKSGVNIRAIQLQGRWASLEELEGYIKDLGLSDFSDIRERAQKI